MKKNKEYILVTSLCLVIIIFLFRKFIFGEYIFVSADTLAPQAIKQSLKSTLGTYPLWFPYIFSGMPTVHSLLNINNYYFPHLFMNLLYDLGMPWIWNYLFHYVFSAIGMYALVRFLRQSKLSAFLSAVLFSTSPYMIAYLVHGHGSQIMTASYIPWIILFLFKIYKNNNINNFCTLSLLVGLQLQRGHIQIVYYTWMMMGLFICINILSNIKSGNINLKKYFYKKVVILSSILLGFLTSLSIYLPIFNYSKISTRGNDLGGFGIDQATQWSLSLKELTTFILPNAYGFGGQSYWGYLPFTDFPNYIGIIVLFLAVIGYCKSNINKEYKLFFISVIILSFLISLGHNFIIFYKIFYDYLPFFNKFRVPIFILILFQFSIYVFASIGITKLPELIQNQISRKIIFSIILSTICIYTLFSFRDPQLFRPELFNVTDMKIFNDIKSEYSSIFNNVDLNYDNVYDNKDSEILTSWLNHDYKVLLSKINFSKYSNTNEYNINTLIRVLKSTDIEVDKSIENIKKDYIYIIFLLIFMLIFIYLYYKYNIPARYFLGLLIALIISDYIRVSSEVINHKYHIPNKLIVQEKDYLNKYLSPDDVVNYFKDDNSKFRILDKSGNYNKNRWAAFNLETIDGYHPAKINLYDKLLKRINTKGGGVYHTGLLQLLNVKYIIHRSKGSIPNFHIVNNISKTTYKKNISNQQIEDLVKNNASTFKMSFFNTNDVVDNDVYIYKNNNLLNRIFFVKSFDYINNIDEVLDKIINKNFNPHDTSYIVKDDLTAQQINIINQINYNDKSKVELVAWESDKITFKAETTSPQIILFSEIFHPGWIIKDENIEIFRINGLFRGIVIPKGSNEFIMKFKPIDIVIGQWISIISYIFIFIGYLYTFYRRKNV